MRLSSNAAKEDLKAGTRRTTQHGSSAHGYGRRSSMAQSGGGSPAGHRTSAPGGNLSDSINLQVLRHLESVFRSADANSSGELDMEEFVAAFKGVISTPEGSDDEALRKLFMRIDANCDATVEWNEFSAYLLLEKTNSSGGAAVPSQGPAGGSSGLTFSSVDAPVLAAGVAHRELISGLMHVDTGNGPDKWYSTGKNGTVGVWNGKDLSHQRTLQTPLQCITAASYLPGSGLLALGSYSPCVLLVDPASGEQAGKLPAAAGSAALSLAGWQEGGAAGLGLAGGRELLGVGDADGGVSLLEVLVDEVADKKSIKRYHGRQLWRCVNHHDWVVGVTPLPQLSSLLAASLDKQLTMTDLERRIAVKTLTGHEKSVTCCAWSGMYKMAISGGADRLLVLWNPFSSRPLGQLAGHVAPLVAVAVNEREHQVISAAADKTIKVWDLRNQRCLQTLQDRVTHSPEDTLSALAYSPSRKLLVSGAYSLRAWPLTDGATAGVRGHRDPVSWVGFNPMFCEAVSTDHAGTVCVWHVASGKLRFAFANTHGSCRISTASFDSNHRRLITGAEDGSVKVWNFSSGALLSSLATPDYSHEWGSGSGAEVTGLAVSGSNSARNFVVAGWDRKVTWYDDSGKRRCNLLRSSPGPSSDILAAAPMQGYPTLATACYNGEVWLWNLESGAVRRKLLPHGHASRPVNEQPVERLAFMHRDLRHILVAVGADRMLRFWECFSGALLCEHFTAHQQGESVAALAVAPDNSTVVTADTAGYIMVWDISGLRLPSANRAAYNNAAAGSRPSSAVSAAAARLGSHGPQDNSIAGIHRVALWRGHADAVTALDWIPAPTPAAAAAAAESAHLSAAAAAAAGAGALAAALGSPRRADDASVGDSTLSSKQQLGVPGSRQQQQLQQARQRKSSGIGRDASLQDAEPSQPRAQHGMQPQHQAQEANSAAAAGAGAHLGFLVSASLDSSLCLWSSAGALVGVVGRHSWTMEDTSSWQSSARAPLKAGEEFDMLVSSSQLAPAAATTVAAAISGNHQQQQQQLYACVQLEHDSCRTKAAPAAVGSRPSSRHTSGNGSVSWGQTTPKRPATASNTSSNTFTAAAPGRPSSRPVSALAAYASNGAAGADRAGSGGSTTPAAIALVCQTSMRHRERSLQTLCSLRQQASMGRAASTGADAGGPLFEEQSASCGAYQEQDVAPAAAPAAAASPESDDSTSSFICQDDEDDEGDDAHGASAVPQLQLLQQQQQHTTLVQTSAYASSKQRSQSALQAPGRVRTSRVGFSGLAVDKSPFKQQQQQPVQLAPSCLQQTAPDQYAAGAIQDEDSEPAVAEEDIPSSLWLPEFVGRKAAVAAACRQPRGAQLLLKAGHYSRSRGSMPGQGRPSSAAAALGVSSVRPGSSGRLSLFESSGVGSSTTHSRPVGGLLQDRARPSSAAPKMQH